LFGEGVEVPLQPLPQLGEFGALVFPKEDEVRADLARHSGMVTRMELGGYVVCAAVTSLARAFGISEEQLLSGAALELQTHGTPLLLLSTSKNQVDHAASMKTLASSIHATPCPLPVPSSAGAKDDITSPGQRLGSPPEVVPTKEEPENPTALVTPEAPGRLCRTRRASSRLGGREESRTVRQISMQAAYGNRPASSQWTGVSWCPRGPMAEVGIAPGAPFPLENGGSRLPANNNAITPSHGGGDSRMSHGSTSDSSSSTAQSNRHDEEDAAEGESSRRRRKRNDNEVLQGSEGKPEVLPATSLDDDPNEALPRLNPVQSDDEHVAEAEDEEEAGADEEDAGAEHGSDETPVTREKMTSLRELQEATARAIARLESVFLAKPAGDGDKKRKRRRKHASGKGKPRKARRTWSTSETASEDKEEADEGLEGHIRSSSSAILQEALSLLHADKGWKVRFT
ncbi:unnamed protein product, partial [Closterium sp. NIES-54]